MTDTDSDYGPDNSVVSPDNNAKANKIRRTKKIPREIKSPLTTILNMSSPIRNVHSPSKNKKFSSASSQEDVEEKKSSIKNDILHSPSKTKNEKMKDHLSSLGYTFLHEVEVKTDKNNYVYIFAFDPRGNGVYINFDFEDESIKLNTYKVVKKDCKSNMSDTLKTAFTKCLKGIRGFVLRTPSEFLILKRNHKSEIVEEIYVDEKNIKNNLIEDNTNFPDAYPFVLMSDINIDNEQVLDLIHDATKSIKGVQNSYIDEIIKTLEKDGETFLENMKNTFNNYYDHAKTMKRDINSLLKETNIFYLGMDDDLGMKNSFELYSANLNLRHKISEHISKRCFELEKCRILLKEINNKITSFNSLINKCNDSYSGVVVPLSEFKTFSLD